MSAFDLVFRAPRVVTASSEVAACVAVRDGRVAAVEPLRAALTRWAASARAATGVDAVNAPGAGAAGGVGFAALVFLRARLRSGIDYLLDLLQVRAAIDGARLVVTGEIGRASCRERV